MNGLRGKSVVTPVESNTMVLTSSSSAVSADRAETMEDRVEICSENEKEELLWI